jgi:hypothetical protein
MEISVRTKPDSFVELRIDTHNVTITEDLTVTSIYENKKVVVPDATIEQFITVANDCSRFNGISDLDFVKNIYEAFLNDYEREQFLEAIKGGNNEQ